MFATMDQRLPDTEGESNHNQLEEKSVTDLIKAMNEEDATVAHSVRKSTENIAALAEATFQRMDAGGRLFYIGSGTSGRLGIVDASECPPTFGVDAGRVIGIIAGGDSAVRVAVERAEDDEEQAWVDLEEHGITPKDVVVGISASGRTPYVKGGLKTCRSHGITTGSISCSSGALISQHADYPVEVVTGPEFVTGSTRMKAGTAQKMVLNMLTTTVMIKLGHVKGNRMVDMQLSNDKLVDRGTRMIMEQLQLDYKQAKELLLRWGNVRLAIDRYLKK